MDLGYNAMAENFSSIGETYTTFPSGIIPVDVKEISINQASLATFTEDAFEDFHQLESLTLDYNPFNEMPNLIPVGNTLKYFRAVNCGMTQLNATVYNELRILETLNVRGCPIVSFPWVEAGPRDTLRLLNLGNCEFTSFPSLAGYTVLYFILLSNNGIKGDITEEDVSGIPNFRKLNIDGTNVTGLPESPRLLDGLNRLEITNTKVSIMCIVMCVHLLTLHVVT